MVTVVSRPGTDSAYAWRLALVSAFCICLGGGSIYLPVVAPKEIAGEFGHGRSRPSVAYLLGFFFLGLGGGSIYLPVVALKEIAAEFGDRRSVPSFAYLLGFFSMGVGGVVM